MDPTNAAHDIYVPFLSTVIQHLRNVFGLRSCVRLKHRICWTVCFLSLLFNALYSYNRSADGSFLDVLAFHILAGPCVCVSIQCFVFESLMFLLILLCQISPASVTWSISSGLDWPHVLLWSLYYAGDVLYAKFMEFISHPKASWITGGITVLWGPSALVDFEKYAVL